MNGSKGEAGGGKGLSEVLGLAAEIPHSAKRSAPNTIGSDL